MKTNDEMDLQVSKLTNEERILESIAEARKMKAEAEDRLERFFYELGVERMNRASNDVLEKLRN